MARPKKQTVDYFPHDCNHKATIFILEENYGNNGYAFWFKVLELLASTEGHYYDCRNPHKWKFLQAKTHLEESLCIEILGLLAELGAIDQKLWKEKIIWSDNFISRISDVYKNRRVEIPSKPSFYKQKPEQDDVSTDINPQSKVKESKVKENSIVLLDFWNSIEERGLAPKHELKGEIGEDIKKAIDKLLEKKESIETIKQAIENYLKILSDEKYFFKYVWRLDQFLRQKNAYWVFKQDFNILHNNFMNKKPKESKWF